MRCPDEGTQLRQYVAFQGNNGLRFADIRAKVKSFPRGRTIEAGQGQPGPDLQSLLAKERAVDHSSHGIDDAVLVLCRAVHNAVQLCKICLLGFCAVAYVSSFVMKQRTKRSRLATFSRYLRYSMISLYPSPFRKRAAAFPRRWPSSSCECQRPVTLRQRGNGPGCRHTARSFSHSSGARVVDRETSFPNSFGKNLSGCAQNG